MSSPGFRGRPREVEFREVRSGVRYLVRPGYGWFRELARRVLFQPTHDVELIQDRDRAGNELSPAAVVTESQSVKAPHTEAKGHASGKKIVGRNRYVAVDTDGRLMMVNLTTADILDSAGAQMVVDALRKHWPWVSISSPMPPTIGSSSWTSPPISTSS